MSEPAEQHEQDAVAALRARGRSPELAAFLAWLLPGAGHLYAGYRLKGGVSLVLLGVLYAWGLGLSHGDAISLDRERGHPYAMLAQVGAGGPTLLTLAWRHGKLPGLARPVEPRYDDPDYVARLPDLDTGLLFTMLAGLLNMLLVQDAWRGVPGALSRRQEEERLQRRIEALRGTLTQELAAEVAASPAAPAAPALASSSPEEPGGQAPAAGEASPEEAGA